MAFLLGVILSKKRLLHRFFPNTQNTSGVKLSEKSVLKPLLQNNPRKPKVSIQTTKNAKSNIWKRKTSKIQVQVQTNNERRYSRPLLPFLNETETKYEMETKGVLINKEWKQIYKRRRRRDAREFVPYLDQEEITLREKFPYFYSIGLVFHPSGSYHLTLFIYNLGLLPWHLKSYPLLGWKN